MIEAKSHIAKNNSRKASISRKLLTCSSFYRKKIKVYLVWTYYKFVYWSKSWWEILYDILLKLASNICFLLNGLNNRNNFCNNTTYFILFINKLSFKFSNWDTFSVFCFWFYTFEAEKYFIRHSSVTVINIFRSH